MDKSDKALVDHALWILLIISYSIIFLVATGRIFRIWLYRHRFWSFQGAFLLLCVGWSTLRITFWSCTSSFLSSLSSMFPLFIYWAPDVLQFAMLSLISLYSYKIVKIRTWKKVRIQAYSTYIISNVGIAVGLTTWLTLQRQAKDNGTPIANSGLYFAIASGMIYGVMVAVLVYYGWRVYRIRLRARSRSLRHPFSTSTAMAGLTFAVFLVFIVKPISAFQSDVLDLPDNSPDSITLSNFFLIVLCELLPTSTILMVFRAVPSSRVTRCTVCCRRTQSLEEFEETLIGQHGQQWSASNSQEYWDRRRKSDLGLDNGMDNGNGVVRNNNNKNGSGLNGGGLNGGGLGGSRNNSGVLPNLGSSIYSSKNSNSNSTLMDQREQERHLQVSASNTRLPPFTSADEVRDSNNYDIEDTRDLYDSDSESSPFARARDRGSTPGTPLFLPPSGHAEFVPPIPGSSPVRGAHFSPNGGSSTGSPRSGGKSLAGLGPRDLLASVSSSYRR